MVCRGTDGYRSGCLEGEGSSRHGQLVTTWDGRRNVRAVRSFVQVPPIKQCLTDRFERAITPHDHTLPSTRSMRAREMPEVGYMKPALHQASKGKEPQVSI